MLEFHSLLGWRAANTMSRILPCWISTLLLCVLTVPCFAQSGRTRLPVTSPTGTVPSERWFLLQKVDRDAPQSVLRDDRIDGVSVRVNWRTLEPSDNQFDWTYLDRQIQLAKQNGKLVMLRVMAGVNAPKHAFQSTTRGLPTPWEEHHIAQFDQLMSAMGRRYQDASIWLVHVPGFWESAEMHLPKGFGYDSQMIQAWNARIASVAKAFPTPLIALNHSPESFSEPVIARFRRLVGTRAAIQMNALKASTDQRWKGYQRILDASDDGMIVGWQFIGPSVNQRRFGGPFSEAVRKGRAARPRYWEFYAPDLQQVFNAQQVASVQQR